MNTKHQSKAEKKVLDEIFAFLKGVLNHQFDEASVQIGRPPKRDMGDYAVACFSFAKTVGQKPNVVAESLADEFKAKKTFSKDGALLQKAKSFGPYLNFFIDWTLYTKLTLEQVLREGQSYGNSHRGRKTRIMIEFSQPNTHKEFHVGHLRNLCIGWSLVNLYRTLGYKVYGVNYIGDVGAHVAKCLWAYIKFHRAEQAPFNKGKYLGEIYAEAVKKIEANEEYQKEVSQTQQKLEAGDRKLLSLWKKTRRWSLEEFYAIYRRLDVHFDHYFFESQVERQGKRIVSQLLKKNIAKKSEGAVVVDLEKYGLKTFLLLKSDGTSLYSTKDLALARLKFKKYKVDKSMYVVDARQSLYFKQLFKTLELMGFDKDMVHVSYEFVNTKEGAMSSRAGNIVRFQDFEKQLIDYAMLETKKRHPNWKTYMIKSVAKGIAYAALKHDMQSCGNNIIITFDIQRALRFNGRTGPYLIYVYARINSILRKAGGFVFHHFDWSSLQTLEERELISCLSAFPEKIADAARNFDPSILTQYLHDIAKAFSVFYQEVSVLHSEKDVRHARLALILAVKTVLEKGLKILGIAAVERM